MKIKKYLVTGTFLGGVLAVSAQSIYQQSVEQEFNYRRSSLYQMLINHSDQKFAGEIRTAFMQVPTPDRFNNHDLSVKVIDLDKKLKGARSDNENEQITNFLEENLIASRMVGKWFNRDFYTGLCDMELVKERGIYGATEFDKVMASKSTRREALLADAGEELIGKTFVVVNDIRYIDKEKRSKVAAGVLRGFGAVLSAAAGSRNNMFDGLANVVESIKGFRVKINSFLYRLDWNDEIANEFYSHQWGNKIAFESGRDKYHLTYVGKVESSGSTTSVMGVKLDQPINMVRKACQRALDENIVDLQRQYVEFRSKSPLISTSPITAHIGMKEGVTENSKFEVLEVVEQEDGTHTYQKVGEIKPIKNMIWDNRYMASEEGSDAALLGITTFKKISGKDFAPGMLIREI